MQVESWILPSLLPSSPPPPSFFFAFGFISPQINCPLFAAPHGSSFSFGFLFFVGFPRPHVPVELFLPHPLPLPPHCCRTPLSTCHSVDTETLALSTREVFDRNFLSSYLLGGLVPLLHSSFSAPFPPSVFLLNHFFAFFLAWIPAHSVSPIRYSHVYLVIACPPLPGRWPPLLHCYPLLFLLTVAPADTLTARTRYQSAPSTVFINYHHSFSFFSSS